MGRLWWTPRRVFTACLAARLVCACITLTAFAPDEFWQGPEVAHRMVFRYGHLTWEWAAGLRSYLHPTLYALLYWALAAVGGDSAWMVAKGPQLLHAVTAAVCDLFVYKLGLLLFGTAAAQWTAVCQLLSWFNAYCLTRTYSSSIEAPLTAAGVYWLLQEVKEGTQPKKRGASHTSPWRWILVAALSIAIRPPSGMFWAVVAVWYLFTCQREVRLARASLGIAIGTAVLAAVAAWDRVWYGRWVIVPWNFFAFNLLAGGSEQYGVHPWHWNLSCGVPTLLASLLPLAALGLAKSNSEQLTLAKLAAVQIVMYSLPAHKEFRFLLPALQLIIPYCGLGAAALWGSQNSAGPRTRQKAKGDALRWQKGAVAALLFLQVPMTIFFSVYHQRGQVQVLESLRQGNNDSVLFLTPCHTTPFYSYIHRPIPMRFFDCSPPGWTDAVQKLNAKETGWLMVPGPSGAGAPSERQRFEAASAAFLEAIFEANSKARWPTVIVGFAQTMDDLGSVLKRRGYAESSHLWNCALPADGNNECSISIYRRRSTRFWGW